jgi:hypothetical protein
MKRSTFLLISGIAAFLFGAMMFFLPGMAAQLLGIAPTPAVASVLRGMGGLIIGSGVINFLVRNYNDTETLKAVLLTNIVTHLFGLLADLLGVNDGALTIIKMAPVEATHLFVGIGSLIFLLKLKNSSVRLRNSSR